MGLFSFLFSKHKILRTTHEAEIFRQVFRENEGLFLRVEASEELKRYRELEEQIDSPQFKQRKKEIDQLSYKGSEYYKAEAQYKALLKHRKLKAYCQVYDSMELKGYEKMKTTDVYEEYVKLRTVVKSVGFDKKLHATEYAAYREIIKDPKVAALIKFENLQKYKDYCDIKDTNLPGEFEKLTAYVQSAEFKEKRKFLIDKDRYKTTDDYKLVCEFEALKKHPDIVKYNSLMNDPYFKGMLKWRLAFEDDFNGGVLDETKWITRYYAGERFLNDTYGVGQDVQLFTRDNISFGNSVLSLHFRKESIIGKYWDSQFGIREKKYEYTSAMISSATSFRQRYGRFEAKIRLSCSGLSQCFWMLGDADVPHVEVMKSKADGVYTGNAGISKAVLKNTCECIKNLHLANEYYIFTLEWTEDKLVWMVNDLVVKEVRENVPDVPMYVIFSLAANECPPAKCVPGRMDIDWVRAYRLKN